MNFGKSTVLSVMTVASLALASGCGKGSSSGGTGTGSGLNGGIDCTVVNPCTTGGNSGGGSGSNTGGTTTNGSGNGSTTGGTTNSSGNSTGNGTTTNSGGTFGGTTNSSGSTNSSTTTNSSGTLTNSLELASGCDSIESCVRSGEAGSALQAVTTLFGSGADAQGSVVTTVGGSTLDTGLLAKEAAEREADAVAENIVTEFQMDSENARVLAKLTTRVKALSAAGRMTSEDQQAITQNAMDLAGISAEDIKNAMTQVAQSGDQKAIDALMNKAADRLGMPSSAGLREKLLPTLGIKF